MRIQAERAAAERAAAADGLGRAHKRSKRRASRDRPASPSSRARGSSTNGARAPCAHRNRRSRGLEARLTSLEELQAARAGFGDAPRAVLAQANGKVNQQGAIADYLEVDSRLRTAPSKRTSAICCSTSLSSAPNMRPPGLTSFARPAPADAGFLSSGAPATAQANLANPADLCRTPRTSAGLVPLSSTVRVNGPFAESISSRRSAKPGSPTRTNARATPASRRRCRS